MSKENWCKEELLCKGTVMLQGGKKGTRFNVYGGEFDDKEITIRYESKYAPGYIYKAEVDIQDRRPVAVRHLELTSTLIAPRIRANIQLESRAHDKAIAAEAKAKRLKADLPDLAEQLSPLRAAYMMTNAEGKSAIEVLLLKYLKTGRF